jgi:hypothetical protein
MNIDQELGSRETKEESATTKTDFCMLQQTRRGNVFRPSAYWHIL